MDLLEHRTFVYFSTDMVAQPRRRKRRNRPWPEGECWSTQSQPMISFMEPVSKGGTAPFSFLLKIDRADKTHICFVIVIFNVHMFYFILYVHLFYFSENFPILVVIHFHIYF